MLNETDYKKIDEFPNYKISREGIIINKNEKIIKPKLGKDGYYKVCFWKNSKPFFRRRARVVGQVFIPNPENKPTINHINGIKTDDRVDNLEWATYSEQNIHAFKNNLVSQRGINNNSSVLTENQIFNIIKLKNEGFGLTKICKILNVNYYTARHVFYNKTHKEMIEKIMYTIGETKLQGDEKVKEFLRDNPEFTQSLESQLLEKIKL